MNHVVIMLSLLLAAVLQTVWPAWESMGSSRLPLFVSVVLYYTLTRSTIEAVTVALLAGLFQDALSGVPLGYSSFVFVLITAFLNQFKDLLFAYQVLTQVFFGAVACCLSTVILYILLRYGGHVQVMPGLLFGKFVGSLVLGMIVVPLTCRVLEGFDRSLGTGIGDRYA
jgi:rod shape-determining protein MreD